MSANVLPLALAAGTAIGLGLYFGSPAQAAPQDKIKAKQQTLARRTSEVPRAAEFAWNSNAGADIRAKTHAEGHSGSGTLGPRHSNK